MILKNEISPRIKIFFLKAIPACICSIEDPNLTQKIRADMQRICADEKPSSSLYEVLLFDSTYKIVGLKSNFLNVSMPEPIP
jgi:hypothetical protein